MGTFVLNQGVGVVKQRSRAVPTKFPEMLSEIVLSFSQHIISADIMALAIHPVANPVLQMLVSIPTSGQSLIKSMIDNGGDALIIRLMQDQVGSHLLEKIIAGSPEPIFNEIFVKHFQPKFLYLCKDSVANFVVQTLLKNLWTAKQLTLVLDALESELENLICSIQIT